MDPTTTIGAAVLVLGSYLAGSIPTGLIAARLAGGPDLRTVGSGRTGGTNALRALGRNWAALVVAGDLAKGGTPVLVATLLSGGDAALMVGCGFGAVAGSIWSIFIGFRGGRGVGTGVGTMLVVQPLALVLAAPVFFAAVALTGYVSMGSILGAIALVPTTVVAFWLTQGSISPYFVTYVVLGAGLILLSHADNVGRLVRGEERKLDLRTLTGRRGEDG